MALPQRSILYDIYTDYIYTLCLKQRCEILTARNSAESPPRNCHNRCSTMVWPLATQAERNSLATQRRVSAEELIRKVKRRRRDGKTVVGMV